MWERTRDPAFKREYNQWQRLRDRLINEQKQKSWQSFCETLERKFHTDSGAFWRSAKKLQEGNLEARRKIPPLRPEHAIGLVTDAAEKAELFADRLEAAFQTPTGPQYRVDTFQEVVSYIRRNQRTLEPVPVGDPGENDPLCTITAQEIEKVAKQLPMKAPGPDGILNAFLRNGTPLLFREMAKLFDLSLCLGRLPKSWKLAKMAMIAKPGRDHASTKGYRPLSMLSCIARLLEKIIAFRLHGWLERRAMIPAHQSGFRSRRSVCDNVIKLAHEIQRGFSIHCHTVGVFLDIEGAFDSVWHDGLRRKLHGCGVPARLVRWISDFLRQRSCYVEVDGKVSRQVPICAGVPQGSPLSPILFTLYTADLPSTGNIMTFADDVAVWGTSYSVQVARNRVQQMLDSIDDWCSTWRLKLCPQKCVSITFTRRQQIAPAQLTIRGLPVTQKDSAKFLGVTFDRKLLWNDHLRDLRARAIHRLNGLRMLSSYRLGLTTQTLLIVYKAYLRPVLSYCALAWATACEARFSELERVQNSALRACLRAHVRSPIVMLRALAGVTSLREHLHSEANAYMQRSIDTNPVMGEYIGTWRGLHEIYPGTCLATLQACVPVGPWNRPQRAGPTPALRQ